MSSGGELLDWIRADLSRRAGRHDLPEVAAAVAGAGLSRSADEVWTAAGTLAADLSGLGPLQPLLQLPDVTDILVNHPDEVWVDGGQGLVRQPVALADEAEVRALAVRLATLAGRRLDDAAPWVDGQLPGGVRLHAVLPPIAVGGTKISLRLPARRLLTLDELVGRGALPAHWRELLQRLVASRLGFLVSGGTGTGKTTMLAALLSAGDPGERVVVVEDTTELRTGLPHVVSVQARHSNTEGRGDVSLSDLIRQALRMRPDRIVVGECRGAEVTDLLAALNTGHCGCGTVHANSPEDVPARLEALGLMAQASLASLRRQMVSGLQVVVHLDRDRSLPAAPRQVVAIGTLVESGQGRVEVRSALTRRGRGPGWNRLIELLQLPEDHPAGQAPEAGAR